MKSIEQKAKAQRKRTQPISELYRAAAAVERYGERHWRTRDDKAILRSLGRAIHHLACAYRNCYLFTK